MKMTYFERVNNSYNLVDYIRSREYGMRGYRLVNKDYGTRHILTHNLLKERSIPLEKMDAVFCSQWLSSNQIVFGTRCNKLMVYNVKSHELDQIPLIKGRFDGATNHQNGNTSLKINPSRTLLATGAYNYNKIGVYKLRLPTLDPIVLAEVNSIKNKHVTVIYTIVLLGCSQGFYIQDTYQGDCDSDVDLKQPVTQFLHPIVLRKYKTEKLRVKSITFNKSLEQMVTFSQNGYVHVWDIQHFKRKSSIQLPDEDCRGNYCMAMINDSSLYAVGCKSNTLLLDSRTLETIQDIPVNPNRLGIWSLSFQDNVITIGTGVGVIMFYDIRAGKYLESSINSSRKVALKTRHIGHVDSDDFGFQQVNYKPPAIYTHCYDYSGTRLFAAGGPILDDKFGNYAGLWQ
eukprot:XP_016658973.1 PREDICTED: DDB1- and CUL4-associated factor 12-like [Acyrthosiphon pisum]